MSDGASSVQQQQPAPSASSGKGAGGGSGIAFNRNLYQAPPAISAQSAGLGGIISNQPGYSQSVGLDETIRRERQALKPGNTSALLNQLSPFEMQVFGADRAQDINPIDPRLFDPSVSPEQRAKNAAAIYNARQQADPWAAFAKSSPTPGGQAAGVGQGPRYLR